MGGSGRPARQATNDVAPEALAERLKAWLSHHGGERVDPKRLVSELCAKLVASGVPLSRVSYGVETLHPQLRGSQFIWRREGGEAAEIRHKRGIEHSEYYLRSPVRALHQGAALVRRRLDVPEPRLDYPILRELLAQGVSDYVVMPLRFSSGRVGYLSWACDRPGGFDDTEIALLADLLPLIALRLEIETDHRVSESLLTTYLGSDAAGRVLAGEVTRGEGHRIRAAILLADLQGFTALSDRLPADQVISYLNDYFSVMVTHVHNHKGEVLKFMGDGLLAVFDIEGSSRGTACCQAVNAAIDGVRALSELNRGRGEALGVGVALHLGDVVYGNIGAEDRLDFTVIGAAVNEAARIEELCGALGRRIITSASFARSCTCRPLVSLGRHRLRDVSRLQELFTVEEGAEERRSL